MGLELLELNGTILWQAPVEVSLPANTSRRLWSMATADLLMDADAGNVVLSARLSGPDTTTTPAPPPNAATQLASALLYFLPPVELALETPAIQVRWEEGENGITLTLVADVLAKDVYLSVRRGGNTEGIGGDSVSDVVNFEENFFDLLPGRPRSIGVATSLPVEELRESLRIRTLAEVPREGTPTTEDPGVGPV